MHNSGRLYTIACNFIQGLALVFTGILLLSGLLFTCYAQDMTSQEVLTVPDNPLISLPGMLILGGVFLGLGGLFAKSATRRKPLLLALVMVWILMCGGLLILFGRTAPAADAWSVYSAAEALAAGDTSVIHPTDSYLSYYPQQVGLMAFWELLIRLWNLLHLDLQAYHFIKCLYVLLTCSIVYTQYRTVHLLWADDRIDCIYLLLAGCNLPLIMYSSFVYGETPSFAALSAGIYFLMKLLRSDDAAGRTPAHPAGDAVLCILFLTLSVLLRKNSLILLIAVLLVTVFEALNRRRYRLLLLCLIGAILSVSILPITRKAYELRAGNTLQDGVPAMSYFAMGMQESSRGNGWYNGYNFNTYQESDMDTRLTTQRSEQFIEERIAYFKAHPAYAMSFYFYKYLSQWADGTYASRQATLATLGERHPFFQKLYDGAYSQWYIGFCNIYQSVLYLGCFAFFFLRLWKRRATALYLYLGLIGAFGGFLFHMIWEANARYIFLYGLLLIPYAAAGLSGLGDRSRP